MKANNELYKSVDSHDYMITFLSQKIYILHPRRFKTAQQYI